MPDDNSELDFAFDTSGVGPSLDPAGIGSEAEPAEPGGSRRKRRSDAGQPRGPRGTGRKAKTVSQVDLSGITALFVGVHVVLADATHNPEFAINEDEGKMFLSAAENVARHYHITSTQKTIDWLAFIGIAGMIYLPRVVAVTARKREERQQNTTGRLVPFNRPRPQPVPPQHQQAQQERPVEQRAPLFDPLMTMGEDQADFIA